MRLAHPTNEKKVSQLENNVWATDIILLIFEHRIFMNHKDIKEGLHQCGLDARSRRGYHVHKYLNGLQSQALQIASIPYTFVF